jgi:hypothetical protein
VAGYLALLWVVLAAVGQWNLRNRNAWALGDWLINYEGGFVRRGLPGEMVYLLARALHCSPLPLVDAVQMGLYGVLFVAVWKLVRRSSGRLWVFAFVLSPATLAFPVLDLLGGFRKEELYLAGLAGLLVLLGRENRRNSASDWHVGMYLSGLLGVLALSHEAMICFAPYLFAGLVLRFKDWRRVLRAGAPALLVGGALCAAAVTHPGTARVAGAVCDSLGMQGVGLCGGAIAALGDTTEIAREQVRQMVAALHPAGVYAGLLVLALLPWLPAAVSLGAKVGGRTRLRVIAVASALSGVCSSVLFLYALDWGRWISIHAFSVFLLLVFVDQELVSAGQERSVATGFAAWREFRAWEFRKRWSVACSVVLLVAYATLWNLPRVPSVATRRGFFSLFRLM